MDIYPGLKEEDFQNTRALQGLYVYTAGKLEFRKDENIQEHSAGPALAPEGMRKLFQNVLGRLQKKAETNQDVDRILADLSQADVTYTNEEFKLHFTYRDGKYYLEEKDATTPQRKHMTIVLTEDTAENFRVRSGQEPPREGPLAITIDAYQNNLDKDSAQEWIKNSSNSNFKLSPDGKITSTKVDNRDAYAYLWSGLYNGDSIVVATDEWIYMFSVTYNDPNDEIRKDFRRLMDSVQLK